MNYSGKLSKEINLSPSSILYYNQDTSQYQSAFAFIENIFTELEEVIYPYGSYYITSQNINPSVLGIPGKWILCNEGLTPISASDDLTLGEIGGEYYHTLTISQTPNHGHNWPRQMTLRKTNQADEYGGVNGSNKYTSYSGENYAHDNTMPFNSFYFWRRVE